MVRVVFCLILVTIQLILPSISYEGDLYDDNQPSSDDGLAKYWGITDTDTIVGKLFQCKIPPERDAFKGTIVEYDVEGEKANTLPKWLIFDKKRSMLEGVATMQDIGDTRINVKAYDTKGKFVSDMFVIEVYPLESENTNNKKKCKSGEEAMMLAIIIEKSLEDISVVDRISAIRNLARHVNIPQNTILLLPQILEIDNSPTYLRTDSERSNTNTNSSVLTWQIGCNERIWAEQMRIMSLVKKYANENALSEMLQLPATKWRIIANFNPFRIRREIGNGTIQLDDNDDNDTEDEEDADDDDDENIRSSSSSLQSPLSSINLNGTSVFEQTPIEENPSWSQPSNTTRLVLSQENSSDERGDEETATEQDDLIDGIFDTRNETFSRAPTPDMDSSQTPFRCESCGSTEGNATTEKIATTVRSNIRSPPRVVKNFGPLTVVAGKIYREQIPDDIFEDEIDGNTRNLTLRLLQESDRCKQETAWIELDAEKQVLLMVPSSDTISNYNLTLEATNSANMSSNLSILIGVQYSQEERKINFEVSLHLYLKEGQSLNASLQLQLMDLIAELYKDANADKITLRHVICDKPLVFTWTNNTLPLDSCDNSTIFMLTKVLTDVDGVMNVNRRVHQTIGPLITVEKVTWQGKSLCEGIVPPARFPYIRRQNFRPIVRNPIDNITARVGELFVFKVPEDSFYDADVESMRELRLTLTLLDPPTLPPDNWLQFDEKNFEIYGLPMNADVGSMTYNLVCYDNEERTKEQMAARMTIEVKVEPATRKPYNVEFSMTLNSSYTSFAEFSRVPLLRRMFIKKLAELFGDADTKSIVISGYAPGSLIVIWHNETLPVHTCPEDEIEGLRKVLLTDRKELNERVNRVLAPEFQAVSALLSPIGVCEGGLTEIHATEPTPVNTASQEIHSFLSKANFHYYLREYFTDIILPAIIIISMMMFAGIIACVLYKRQRRDKWNLNDETERRTYRSKGIPVIFQDELEERLETSNKSPIIMKEEKPPLPPPEYQKTLPIATTALLSDFDDPSYHQEGGSYSTRSVERNGRDKGTPTYRKPPPYLPP